MGPLSFALTLLALGTEAVRDMSFALEGALVANGDEPYCANWEATDPNFPRFCQGAVLSDGSGRRIMDVCSQACSRAVAKLHQPVSNAQHAIPSGVAGVQQAQPSGDDPRCVEWYGGGDLKSIYCSSTMHFANDPNQPLIRDVCKDLCSSTADSRDEDDPFCKHYDNQHAEFYCTSGTMATADKTVAQLCKKLCAKHQGGSPPANTGGQVGGTFQNPQQLANGGVPFQASYSQFLNWKPTVATSCPAPGQCFRGGYGEGQRPSFGWDICSGCWQETCVRDLNFEAEARMFRPGSMPADFYAGLKLLEKAYPLGADMWAYQRKLAEREGGDPLGNKLLTGVVGFMNTKDLESWIDCLNSPVHENTHVHHSSTGIFRPSNDMAYGIRAPWMKPCEGGPQNCYYDMEVDWSINSQFPMRGEVRSMFPLDTEDILDAVGGPMYIRGDLTQCNPNSEGGPRGCQRLHGLMTETEGYLHGELSSAVLASAVGIDSTFTPRITPAKPGNQGGTFPVAFWSLVNVYYLQLVKDKYPSTWANLLNRGTQDWTKISEIFLAHIDRSTWYLRLALDVNDMTDLLHKDGIPPAFPPYKALSNKCRNLQEAALSVDDVLKPLREALRPSGCKRASA